MVRSHLVRHTVHVDTTDAAAYLRAFTTWSRNGHKSVTTAAWRDLRLAGQARRCGSIGVMRETDQGEILGPVRWTEVFESIDAEEFTELALLAREVSRAPIALVTLVDGDRQLEIDVERRELVANISHKLRTR